MPTAPSFSAAILVTPQQVDEDACICPLAEGEEVNFYQVIPLYQDEMEYKIRFRRRQSAWNSTRVSALWWTRNARIFWKKPAQLPLRRSWRR